MDILNTDRANKKIFPATLQQKGIFLHIATSAEQGIYNYKSNWKLSGNLNFSALKRAIEIVISENSILRTNFAIQDTDLVQVINQNFQVDHYFVYEDFSKIETNKKKDKSITACIKNFFGGEFNLTDGVLIKFKVLILGNDHYQLLIVRNHLIMDISSFRQLKKSLTEVYNSLIKNKPFPKPTLKKEYWEYALAQNTFVKSKEYQEKAKFWNSIFRNFKRSNRLLSTGKKIANNKSLKTDYLEVEMGKDFDKQVLAFSLKNRVLPSSVYILACNILIAKYTAQKNVLLGMLYKNRSLQKETYNSTIGPFANRLAIYNELNSSLTIRRLLQEVNQNLQTAYRDGEVIFEDIIGNLEGSNAKSSSIEVWLNIFEQTDEKVFLDGLENLWDDSRNYQMERYSEHKIELSIIKKHDSNVIRIDFQKECYEKALMGRFLECFKNIIEIIISDSSKYFPEIKVINDQEKEYLLSTFVNKCANYSDEVTIQSLFKKQVQLNPNKAAIVDGQNSITFAELDKKSEYLAQILRKKGIKSNDAVGVYLERSIDLIIAMLSILKAGGAYLPLDIDYPEDRINYMLEDSKATLVISKTKYTINTVINFPEVIYLEKEGSQEETLSVIVNDAYEGVSGANIAYIIYTSGTTGKPKGSLLTHSNLTSLMFNEKFPFHFSDQDVWVLFHSHCFDVSIWEIFGSLLFGGKLVIIPKKIAINPQAFLNILAEEGVTVLNQTPTAFTNLIKAEANSEIHLSKLRYINFAGEEIKLAGLDQWLQKYPNTKLINMYGITETTIHVTYKEIQDIDVKSGISNVGKSLPNASCYVLDENMGLCGIGMIGEIWVGGYGVSKGYLGKPELTAEKFQTNPYKPDERIYKSGDFGRWLSNGEIEYLGRLDEQTKVRGFRIELKEIEFHLNTHQEILSSKVIARTDLENTLVAYYVSNKIIPPPELKSYLSKKTPGYMIPSYFIWLENMPMTVNGKINIPELPKPDYREEKSAQRLNEIEIEVLDIFSKILKIEKGSLSADTDFFNAGGHSINTFELVTTIQKRLEVEVLINEVFKNSTVKTLSALISIKRNSFLSKIEPCEIQKFYPVSSYQKRIYTLQHLDSSGLTYNIPCTIPVKSNIDIDNLESVFLKLIGRHEPLRTSFEFRDGQLVQVVQDKVNFKIETINQNSSAFEVDNYIAPFILSEAPLMRVKVASNKNGEKLLFMDFHHIIADDRSIKILLTELNELLNGEELPIIPIQYKDYSVWASLKKERTREQSKYWLSLFANEIPVLDFPTDFSRPPVLDFEGVMLKFNVESTLTSRIKNFCKERGFTMNMFLMAAYNVLLSIYSRQEDIIIGTISSGRNHPDLESMVGMFVNTLPLRSQPEGRKTLFEYLKEIKKIHIDNLENQDYAFDELIEKLQLNRDISRNPLFDVMYVFSNNDEKDNSKNEIAIDLEETRIKWSNSKFDLALALFENRENIRYNIQFRTKLFTKESIIEFANRYNLLLEEMINNMDSRISDLEVISNKEKQEITEIFNNTKVVYPENISIIELFKQQVKETPQNTALIFDNQAVTYEELDKKSDVLAEKIIELELPSNHIVALLVDRSPEMIIAMLGVIKAGCAYVPIDVNSPNKRIKYILENTGSQLLVSKRKFLKENIFLCPVIVVEELEYSRSSCINIRTVNYPTDLAYVIYTSGTTGRPKGVKIQHQSILNTLLWRKSYYNLQASDVILQIPSYAFDSSVEDIFSTLISGGKLVLYREAFRFDIQYLKHLIRLHNVTHFIMVPVLYKALLSEILEPLLSLKKVTIAGENFSEALVKEHFKKLNDVELFNEYGPTEDSVCTTVYKFPSITSSIKIGKPIANKKCLIMNKYHKLSPVGIYGELFISGAGLSAGYLNDYQYSEEKFVKINGERFYKTGDLARWSRDGNIEYLGRIDKQVKLRGHRIELSEIESVLQTFKGLEEAVVDLKETPEGINVLQAYFVSKEQISPNILREFLVEQLPEYMVPTGFIQIPQVPLTLNGKVDRKKLLNIPRISKNITPPENDIEHNLVMLWAQQLGISENEICTNQSFFSLGGNSISSIKLLSKIKQVFNVDIVLYEFLRKSTIKNCAEIIIISQMNSKAEIKETKKLSI